MLLVKKHYAELDIKTQLVATLTNCLAESELEPLFIFIGSDRHILDCLGPLAGSMLLGQCPEMLIYGSLDSPLHAKNLVRELELIKAAYPGHLQVAIDASLGKKDDLGTIKIRQGALIPGKALSRRLPPVGDIAITGIVGSELDKKRPEYIHYGSLKDVYHMSKIISEVIYAWHLKRSDVSF